MTELRELGRQCCDVAMWVVGAKQAGIERQKWGLCFITTYNGPIIP